MSLVVLALLKSGAEAHGLVRTLAEADFEIEDIDPEGDVGLQLPRYGVPAGEVPLYVEGVHRGGAVVGVRATDEAEADQAAIVMGQHAQAGLSGVYTVQPGYSGRERRQRREPFFGENRRA
jgi:hypothetical protein